MATVAGCPMSCAATSRSAFPQFTGRCGAVRVDPSGGGRRDAGLGAAGIQAEGSESTTRSRRSVGSLRSAAAHSGSPVALSRRGGAGRERDGIAVVTSTIGSQRRPAFGPAIAQRIRGFARRRPPSTRNPLLQLLPWRAADAAQAGAPFLKISSVGIVIPYLIARSGLVDVELHDLDLAVHRGGDSSSVGAICLHGTAPLAQKRPRPARRC